MDDITTGVLTRRGIVALSAAGAGSALLGINPTRAEAQTGDANAVANVLRRSSAKTMAVTDGAVVNGQGASVTSSAATLGRLSGAGSALSDLTLIAAPGMPGATVIGVQLDGTQRTRLRDISVDLSHSNGAHLPGFNLTGGLRDHISIGINAVTQGYAYLTNNDPAATQVMDGHVLIGFNLTSGGADAIEYNNPGAPMKCNLTWGGILDAGRAGTGAASGMALGIAHNQGWVAGGIVARYARTAGVHIEDGCSFGVLSSVALRGCQQDGIWASIGGYGAHQAEGTPLVITGFSAEGPGQGKRGSRGVFTAYSSSGYSNRWPILGGYVQGFETGLVLDGLGVIPATSVTADDVTTVLQTASGRHFGDLFSNKAGALFAPTGPSGGRAGRFVQSDTAPHAIIDHGAVRCRAPRATVDGFAFPALEGAGVRLAGGEQCSIALFQAPLRARGQLRVTVFTSDGGAFWEAPVICLDGHGLGLEGTALIDASGAIQPVAAGVATFTAGLEGVILTVSEIKSGWLATGVELTAAKNARITRQIGGQSGGNGTYLVDIPQTLPVGPMTANCAVQIAKGSVSMMLANRLSATVEIKQVLVEFNGTFYA